MAKDLYVPVSIRGGRLEAKAQLGQTVIVTEGPEEYTGPVTVIPTEAQQTLQTADKLVKSDISVGPIPLEYVDAKADYDNALTAFGVESDLAGGITALTEYSNEITGEQDETLSDAVRTLANGYGGGGGDENNLVNYVGRYSSLFNNKAIPENVDIHAKYANDFDSMIREAKGIKNLKLAADVPATNFLTFAYNCTGIETVDFSGIINGTNVNHNGTFWRCSSLKTIIGLDLSNASNVTNMFAGCFALENITIKQNTCAINISFVACPKLTNASLVSIANGLAVGSYTLTLHARSKSALQTIVGTVSDGAFTEDADGTATLTDFITNTKGWTVA